MDGGRRNIYLGRVEWVEDCLESLFLVEGEVCVGVCILNRKNDVVNER